MANANLLRQLYEAEKAHPVAQRASFGMDVKELRLQLELSDIDTRGLNGALDSMAAAGLVEQTFTAAGGSPQWTQLVRLSDRGRSQAEAKRTPGRGVILDEPHSSALLQLGLQERLISVGTGTRHLFRRELSKGRSPTVQREMLTSLVLFNEVVIPGDKAATDYFDWSGLEADAGVFVAPHYASRQGIRYSALEEPESLRSVGQDRLSAWDNVLRAYLRGRRLPYAPLPDEFSSTTTLGHDLSTYATAEDLELFLPDLIEFRIRNFLSDRFGPRNQDDPALLRMARGAFWTAESYFHLRYLRELTENEWLPSLIRTKLGSVPGRAPLATDDAFSVYSIFLKEVRTLPRPQTLEEALEMRTQPHIEEFREVFHRWHDAISSGDADEAELRRELGKMTRSARRRKRWGRAAGILTYAGVPPAVLGFLLINPIVGGVSLGLAAIGGATQFWIDRGARKDRWMLVAEL